MKFNVAKLLYRSPTEDITIIKKYKNEILITTPPVLIRHIKENNVKLDSVSLFIIDEIDEMIVISFLN